MNILRAVHLDSIFKKKFAVAPLRVICTIEQDSSQFNKLSLASYMLRQNVSYLHVALNMIKVNLVILDSFFAIMVSHINVSRCIFWFR